MSGVINYLFVSKGKVSEFAYQLNDNGVLGIFKSYLHQPVDEVAVSYPEARSVLTAKPLDRKTLWKKCNLIYSLAKRRGAKSVPEVTPSEQVSLSNLIDAAQNAFNASR